MVIRILARLCLAASAETLNRKPQNAQNRSLWQEEVFSLVAKPVIEDATQHRHLRAMGMVNPRRTAHAVSDKEMS